MLDEARVASLLRAGIALRDARGYNRFRLVLDGAEPPTPAQTALLAQLDDRVHIHCVPWCQLFGV